MRIKLATPLVGEFPRYANVKLPDNAYIRELRIRKQAMYLADFTPPTAPFTY